MCSIFFQKIDSDDVMSSAFDKFRALENKSSTNLIESSKNSSNRLVENSNSLFDADLLSTECSSSSSSTSSTLQQPPTKKPRNISDSDKLDVRTNLSDKSHANLMMQQHQQQQQQHRQQQVHLQQTQQHQKQQPLPQQQVHLQQMQQSQQLQKQQPLLQQHVQQQLQQQPQQLQHHQQQLQQEDRLLSRNEDRNSLRRNFFNEKPKILIQNKTISPDVAGTKTSVLSETSTEPRPELLRKSATTVEKMGESFWAGVKWIATSTLIKSF